MMYISLYLNDKRYEQTKRGNSASEAIARNDAQQTNEGMDPTRAKGPNNKGREEEEVEEATLRL